MKKSSIQIPAKINFTLDIVGTTNGFHNLKSFVASIGIYNKITAVERTDSAITLTEKNFKSGVSALENNAYKAVKLYMNKFSTCGVDLTLEKNIPVGNGLGGSSADIAGALIAVNEIYGKCKNLLPLANSLGSDSGYMLNGGFAVLEGRGDKITRVDVNEKLNILVLTSDKSVSTKESFALYDKEKTVYKISTDKAVNSLIKGDYNAFCSALKNDLYYSSDKLLGSISERIKALKEAGATTALMTGSGAAVYGIFPSEKELVKAYKALKKIYPDNIIKTQTV